MQLVQCWPAETQVSTALAPRCHVLGQGTTPRPGRVLASGRAVGDAGAGPEEVTMSRSTAGQVPRKWSVSPPRPPELG